MLHEIFSSVFQTGSSAFELGPFLACTAVSLLLGLLIAWTHAHGSACSRSFLLTLVMLPAVVQTVIMLVNGLGQKQHALGQAQLCSAPAIEAPSAAMAFRMFPA